MVKPAHIAAHVRSPERGGYRGRRRAGVTALLAAVWLLLDYYPGGCRLRGDCRAVRSPLVMTGPSKVTARAGYF